MAAGLKELFRVLGFRVSRLGFKVFGLGVKGGAAKVRCKWVVKPLNPKRAVLYLGILWYPI